jgi:hypothetical protein
MLDLCLFCEGLFVSGQDVLLFEMRENLVE